MGGVDGDDKSSVMTSQGSNKSSTFSERHALQTDITSANTNVINNYPSKRDTGEKTSSMAGENNLESKSRTSLHDIPSHNHKDSESTRLTESQLNRICQFISVKCPVEVTRWTRVKSLRLGSDRLRLGCAHM